jgi:hypothetical protein
MGVSKKKRSKAVVNINIKEIKVEIPQTTITGKDMDEIGEQVVKLLMTCLKDSKLMID